MGLLEQLKCLKGELFRMEQSAPIKVLRECDATLIPSGEDIKLIKGTVVRITQSLGGDYTLYVSGNLVKLSGKDADAIGKTPVPNSQKNESYKGMEFNEEMVWEQLKTCYDPEIPVNIVDLGLVYDLTVKGTNKEGFDLHVKMTLTAPGCGMGPSIAQDVESKIMSLPNVKDVLVEIVWEPLWHQNMMTEDAKLKLGMF
tara:strand:- start:295 stop:891 length:597 start_codon:yes stop_codon:yes gene_type:complete